ncbi:MAG: hypothetical protein OXC26_07715 [Albidovulum sp.]|nr:hypothetical protein [Albidovulum sp.]
MKTVRDACTPPPNALSIRLSDQIEHLDELIGSEGDGEAFFERTHLTQGILDLVSEGIARLAGASSQTVFHLKQAMGGGKTHLLVGFGLLAKHPALRKRHCAGTSHINAFESAAIAAFNGRNNPAQFFWGNSPTNSARATHSEILGRRVRGHRTRRTGSRCSTVSARSSSSSTRFQRSTVNRKSACIVRCKSLNFARNPRNRRKV